MKRMDNEKAIEHEKYNYQGMEVSRKKSISWLAKLFNDIPLRKYWSGEVL